MENLLKDLVHLAILQRQSHVKVLDDLQKDFLVENITAFWQDLPDEVVVQRVFPLLGLHHLLNQKTQFPEQQITYHLKIVLYILSIF